MSKDLVEKLHYSVQMMHLVEWLGESLRVDDDYVVSVVVRHGTIYLDSFVRYGQRVRNQLAPGGPERKRKLDTIKRDLVELHDDFRTKLTASDHLHIRTELTAHRHDIAVLERVAAWKRIPTIFSDYSTRSMCIYAELASLDPSVPTFRPSSDTADEQLRKAIAAVVPAPKEVARVGTDNLAYARPGTVVLMETHEIHRRLAQVLSILHTIKVTATLYGVPGQKSDTSRLLKSMLIVDIINLLENIYHDPSGRVAEPLLKIAHKHRMSCAPVLDAATRDVDTRREERLRAVRNKIAAHVDDKASLAALIRTVDGISNDDLNALLNPVRRTLNECSRVDPLIRDRTIMQDFELPDVHTPAATRGWI